MKAVVNKQVSNARNYSGDKELVSKWVILGKTKHCKEVRELVDCRTYMARSRSASVVYASLWVHAFELYTSGTGKAGGYGYHKESAAVQDAITSAGITLYGSAYGEPSRWNHEEKREYTAKELAVMKRRDNKKVCHIGGVGNSAIEMALVAIAKAAGLVGKPLIVKM